ncbi:hypothetical protein V494_05044 [Pseudogymnoascus sp. VKM F-4513 (FW-928)]|nr:hypothetical protein V494_05044 [Pseudogymnoascus sp. VKM F-4513 (FW-928)]
MPSTDVSYIPSNSQQQGRQSPFRPSDDNEELQATLSEEEQWLHQPRSQREPIAPTLTLSSLLATHKIAGYFDLPPPLRKLLNAKYAITARAEIDSIYEPPSSSRRAWRARRISVLDTAMVVVYIEVVYWAEKRLWDLVLQKARAWLEAEIPDPEIRKRGLERARELLIPDGTDETGEEAGDGQESVLPGEFWHDDSLEPGVDGGGKGEERVNSEAWFGEGWQAVTGTMAASDAKTPHPLTNEPEAGKRALPSV